MPSDPVPRKWTNAGGRGGEARQRIGDGGLPKQPTVKEAGDAPKQFKWTDELRSETSPKIAAKLDFLPLYSQISSSHKSAKEMQSLSAEK